MTAAATLARDTLLPRALARAWPRAAGRHAGAVVWRGPPRDAHGRRLLHLTVDDGPHAAGTPLWLAALARHGARALVFVSGPAVAARPDLVRALREAGHRVGSHGGPHVSAWRTPPARVLAGTDDAARALEDVLGEAVTDVRPPYGRLTPGLVRWARATGRRVVLWDLMPGDFVPALAPGALAARLVRWARPGSVAVWHDGPPAARAVAALDAALPRLAAAGWAFPALGADAP